MGMMQLILGTFSVVKFFKQYHSEQKKLLMFLENSHENTVHDYTLYDD